MNINNLFLIYFNLKKEKINKIKLKKKKITYELFLGYVNTIKINN